MKNLWGKSRKKDDPYMIVTDEDRYPGWTWRVLTAYKARASEKKDVYARWFCDVSSPYTFGGSDMGDTYISDIPLQQRHLEILDKREEEESA